MQNHLQALNELQQFSGAQHTAIGYSFEHRLKLPKNIIQVCSKIASLDACEALKCWQSLGSCISSLWIFFGSNFILVQRNVLPQLTAMLTSYHSVTAAEFHRVDNRGFHKKAPSKFSGCTAEQSLMVKGCLIN